MNKTMKILPMVVIWVFFFSGFAFGSYLDGYSNITMYDGVGTGSGWHGSQEDQETEPSTLTGQIWDLEGFFQLGNSLALVGGFDFQNGEYSQGNQIDSGDIFIDTTGDAQYGYANKNSGYGMSNPVVDNTFGYDYVLDFTWGGTTPVYSVFELVNGSLVHTVDYKQTQYANPWRYATSSPGNPVAGYQNVEASYMAGLLDDVMTTDENKKIGGGLTGGRHNVVVADLGFLGGGTDFTVHFTQECGNDNLMGSGSSAVPEPTTILLIGSGLMALGGARMRQRKA